MSVKKNEEYKQLLIEKAKIEMRIFKSAPDGVKDRILENEQSKLAEIAMIATIGEVLGAVK